MSENTNPEKDKTSTSSKEKTATKSSAGIIFLALVVGLIGCGIGGYSLYMQYIQTKTIDSKLAQNDKEFNQLNRKTSNVLTNFNQVIESQKQQSLNEDVGKNKLSSLSKKIYALDQQVKAIKSDYLLPESDLYHQMILIQINAAGIYLNMADNYLKLYQGADQALSLIQAAESSLVNADLRAKPALDSLRKAKYAVENAAVFTHYQDNMVNIDQLISLSNQLKLKKPTGDSVNLDKDEPINPDESWQDSLKQSLTKMKSLVQVHQLNDTNKLLINYTQRENLIITLRLLLQQSKWAIQRQDDDVLKESLNQAISDVQTYFQQDINSQKWLEIAKKINLNNSKDYLKAISQAKFAISKLERSIIESAVTRPNIKKDGLSQSANDQKNTKEVTGSI